MMTADGNIAIMESTENGMDMGIMDMMDDNGFDGYLEGMRTMGSRASAEEVRDTVNSFRMLGVILEARTGRKVTVTFPGTDGLPSFPEMLLAEPTEDDWPQDEVHLYVTHIDELYGTSDVQTVSETMAHTRLAEAVIELPSVCLPPAGSSLLFGDRLDDTPGAVIWMVSAETPDEFLERRTLVGRLTERTCPGVCRGLAAGPTGEGFQRAKDFLMELLVNRRVVDGVSCLVDVEDAKRCSLDYADCSRLAR